MFAIRLSTTFQSWSNLSPSKRYWRSLRQQQQQQGKARRQLSHRLPRWVDRMRRKEFCGVFKRVPRGRCTILFSDTTTHSVCVRMEAHWPICVCECARTCACEDSSMYGLLYQSATCSYGKPVHIFASWYTERIQICHALHVHSKIHTKCYAHKTWSTFRIVFVHFHLFWPLFHASIRCTLCVRSCVIRSTKDTRILLRVLKVCTCKNLLYAHEKKFCCACKGYHACLCVKYTSNHAHTVSVVYFQILMYMYIYIYICIYVYIYIYIMYSALHNCTLSCVYGFFCFASNKFYHCIALSFILSTWSLVYMHTL